MSRFSGKCDFYDLIDIHGETNILNSDIYIGDNVIPLKFKSRKDLVPYYPYLVSMSATCDGRGTIILSNKSYVDTNEETILNQYLSDAKRLYRGCKRRKEDYLGECKKYLEPWATNAKREIFRRVGERGEGANIDGIHLDFAEYRRKELYDEMINCGWRKWVAYYWAYKDLSKAVDLMEEE